jgi:peptide-N4-(N-acetyl-beta-glucosaminyl)asparagine amidase
LQFTAQVEGGLSKVLGYEDELAQAMALSIMPLPELEAAAEEAVGVSAAMGEQPLLSREDGGLGAGMGCEGNLCQHRDSTENCRLRRAPQVMEGKAPCRSLLLALAAALAQELLLWFKRDFFTWVNSPPCEHCGAVTRGAGVGGPTADEAAAGAGRTELFHCGQVGAGSTRWQMSTDGGADMLSQSLHGPHATFHTLR